MPVAYSAEWKARAKRANDPWKDLPRTKKVWDGFGTKGWRTISVAIGSLNAVRAENPQEQGLNSATNAFKRSSGGYSRNERYLMARAVEAFERETRGTGKDGRRTQGALKSSGVEIFKAMLWEWLNVKTGALFPSHLTIAKATGWSVRTVRRALSALARAGILSWVKRSIGNRRTSNGYRLGQNCPGTSSQKDSKGVEVSPAPLPCLSETRRNIAQRLGAILLS